MGGTQGSNGEVLNALADLHQVVGERFDRVDRRFDGLEEKINRIEGILLKDHLARIERLESQVEEMKEKLSIR